MAVINSVWNPIKPRDGIMYSRRVRPLPSGTILIKSPLRSPSFSIIPPWWASSTSMVTISNGSCFSPSASLRITSGLDTPNSKPSRRMFSINTDKCSSPRPETLNLSGSPVSSTRNATLCCSSFSKRSRICREVKNLPSFPAKGELLT